MIRYFAIVAFLIGTAFAILNPPLRAPDEENHFLRSYQIATFHPFPDIHNNIGGGFVPISISKIELRFFSYAAIRQRRQLPLNPKQVVYRQFPNTANYPPLVYVPQAVGIRIGRLFSQSVLDLMYAGREANLIAYIATICCGLRLLASRNAQIALTLIALLPMSLYQAASLSADALTIAAAAVFAASIWRIAFAKNNPSKSDQAILIISSVAFTITKIAYAPMLLTILVIPARQLGGWRKYLAFVLCVAAINAAMILWWMSRIGLHPVSSVDPQVSPERQIAYLESNPGIIPSVILQTLRVQFGRIVEGLIGYFGYLEYPLPVWMVACYYGVLAIVFGKGARFIPWRNLLIVLLTALFVLIELEIIEYIVWSPIGDRYMWGFQGRYLIPIACSFVLCIPGERSPLDRFNKLFLLIGSLISAYSVVYLAQRSNAFSELPLWLTIGFLAIWAIVRKFIIGPRKADERVLPTQ